MRADRLSEAAHVNATPRAPAPRPGRAGHAAPVVVRGRLVSVLPTGQDDTIFWLEDDQVDIGRTEGDIRINDPQLAPVTRG